MKRFDIPLVVSPLMNRRQGIVTGKPRTPRGACSLALVIMVFLTEAWGPRPSNADFSAETVDQIMEHVSVSYDAAKHITWYIPNRDTPAADTWIYASLGVRADGERRLVLSIQRLNGDLWFTRSLHVETNDIPHDVRLDPARHRIDGHSTAVGIEETLLMDDQENLIRNIANARQASITLVGGKHGRQQFNLLPKDITSFLRIVTLFEASTLPRAPEGGDQSGEQGQRAANDSRVLTNPRLIEKSKKVPSYPVPARRAGAQGLVILYAVIHKDGSVGDLRVARTPVEGVGFEKAALRAVKKWRYEPALLDGKPVDVSFTILVDFYLKR